MHLRWILEADTEPDQTRRMAAELSIPPSLALVLRRRGCEDTRSARRFLSPRLRALSDPFLIPQMELAVERILEAFGHGEKIVLHGDYDVDGISSLALLYNVFSAYGYAPSCFLPSRMDEGYGLTPEGLLRCMDSHRPHLLIAVDCGTNSFREIAWLAENGVDVIVLDHHEPKAQLPECAALVNPKLGSEFHYLCSAGLAFKLAHALLKASPIDGFDLRNQLDLVALGTLADLVPLRDENRILARSGLERMPQTKSVGLKALQEIAAVEGVPRASDVGFRIGPRLNAAGRLGTAEQALHLLLTTDANEARHLALSLDAKNRERQLVEQRTLADAEAQVAATHQEAASVIVVGGDGWHPGVVGIVAARLCRKHCRPAIVVGFDESGYGRGSGRSIAGFSLVEALAHCTPLLVRHGGHAMAAGLSVNRENFDAFREMLHAEAARQLSDKVLEPCLTLDAEMELTETRAAGFTGAHDALGPFGTGNQQPVFLARGVQPESEPRWLKDRHLSLRIRQGTERRNAIYFGAPPGAIPEAPWDMAFRIEPDDYLERGGVAIHVQGLRPAAR